MLTPGIKGHVNCNNSRFSIFSVNKNRNLDFRCSNHIDVDVCIVKSLKHCSGNA